jgi:predicted ATPase
MTLVHQFRREMAQMQKHLDEMLRLAGELHLQGYLATGGMLKAWAQTFVGGDDATGRIASLRGGLIDRRYSVTGMTEPYFLCLLAEVYGRVGDAEEGLKTVESAIVLAAESATRVWEPELHRSKGALLFVLGQQNMHQTESAFRQALEVARCQEAKSLELRAATSLARLWREQGKTEKARDLLAQVYGWFTEGFDTPDLKEASTLLDELQ